MPHAGHSQKANTPTVGQFPLKTNGKINFLKMHNPGINIKKLVGVTKKNKKLKLIAITIPLALPKLIIS